MKQIETIADYKMHTIDYLADKVNSIITQLVTCIDPTVIYRLMFLQQAYIDLLAFVKNETY